MKTDRTDTSIKDECNISKILCLSQIRESVMPLRIIHTAYVYCFW